MHGCGLTFLEITEGELGQLYLEFHFCTLNRPARGILAIEHISDFGEEWADAKNNWMVIEAPINQNFI